MKTQFQIVGLSRGYGIENSQGRLVARRFTLQDARKERLLQEQLAGMTPWPSAFLSDFGPTAALIGGGLCVLFGSFYAGAVAVQALL